MMTLLFSRAYAISARASRSGTPSAMMATTRSVGCCSAAIEDSNALRCVWVGWGGVGWGAVGCVGGVHAFGGMGGGGGRAAPNPTPTLPTFGMTQS